MSQGNLTHCRLVENGLRLGRLSSRRQAVIKTLGQGAGITMAGTARVFAGFVASHQLQAAQGEFGGAGVELMQGVQSQRATRRLGRQEQNFVQLLRDHGLEQRKQGTEGFADARGGLSHQAASGTDRLVNGLGQFPLTSAKLPVREAQALQPGVTPCHALQLLFCPAQEHRALGIEELFERLSTAVLFDQGLGIAVDIQVHQRQVDVGQLALLTKQPAIDLGLGPVQLPMVVGLARQVAAVGFDFFQAVQLRVVAICPAPHLQGRKLPLKADLGLIARATSGHNPLVAANALQGRG
ncbi:hypothetical protein D3C78_997410 [compost metagenome]